VTQEERLFEFIKNNLPSSIDINKLISVLAETIPNIEQKACIIDGSRQPLTDIERMGYNEFALRSKEVMPGKLYKYFPNTWTTEQGYKKPINYSLEALKNNTVFLQNPDLFDDVYDSDIHIEWQEYAKIRLQIYCQRCECDVNDNESLSEMIYKLSIALWDAWESSKDFLSAFKKNPQNEIEQQSNRLFSYSIETELLQNPGIEWHETVFNVLQKEYKDYADYLHKVFRITCFSKNPYLQLMWANKYADYHKGFCIEYQIEKNNPEFNEVINNLFPVIYCKSRPDITERIVKAKDGKLTIDSLWDIYFHGALRKSIDWFYQAEWRYLHLGNNGLINNTSKFFPISKVFLGCRMDNKDRADIINICHQKNIPYVGVKRAAGVFEMIDCDMLCEDCPRYLGEIK
jgi:hypothetical protein